MHWFRKRKVGKEVGNGAGGAGTGVTQDLKEKDCSFLYGVGEQILNQELWEVSGRILATAVTHSPCRAKLLLWKNEPGLVFVTMAGAFPVIKVLRSLFP